MPAVPIERGEEEQVPNLLVTLPGYNSVTVPLTTDTTRFGWYGANIGYNIEKKGRVIRINEPIILTRSDDEPYDPD